MHAEVSSDVRSLTRAPRVYIPHEAIHRPQVRQARPLPCEELISGVECLKCQIKASAYEMRLGRQSLNHATRPMQGSSLVTGDQSSRDLQLDVSGLLLNSSKLLQTLACLVTSWSSSAAGITWYQGFRPKKRHANSGSTEAVFSALLFRAVVQLPGCQCVKVARLLASRITRCCKCSYKAKRTIQVLWDTAESSQRNDYEMQQSTQHKEVHRRARIGFFA